MAARVDFTHLHVHTYYTLLDGLASPESLAHAALQLGYGAAAITDRAGVYAAVRWQQAAEAAGIEPIFGAELPLTVPPARLAGSRPSCLTVLVESPAGWENLGWLLSAPALESTFASATRDGFAVDLAGYLSGHTEGLIFLTGPELDGWLPALLREEEEAGKEGLARSELARLVEVAGRDRVFVQVERMGLPGEERLLLALRKLARELGLPVVATHDVRYLRPEDAGLHRVISCIREGVPLSRGAGYQLGSDQFYLKNPSEMSELFADWPDALAATGEIAARCRFRLPTGKLLLPAYPNLPAGQDADTYLEELCRAGAIRRYGRQDRAAGERVTTAELPPEIESRLRHELGVIRQMGYAGYFLTVADVVKWAREQGIPVGPGRGSAAGSLVAYVLGITQVDPLRYGLIFERFLNPHRVSPPDIDIDIADDRRSEVIDYVVKTYGRDRVAQIITFGTLAARAAVRDVGRVLELPPPLVDRIARLVPVVQGQARSLAQALEEVPELNALYSRDPTARRLIDLGRQVEGLPRHASVHAAGVVIAPVPLTRIVPLELVGDALVTQFDMESLEQVGLLKMDFLALRHLSIWARVRDRIRAEALAGRPDAAGGTGGTGGAGAAVPELDELDPDDPAVYAQLATGDNPGVFQLDSPLNRRLLPRLRPTRFTDIIAALALGRPGPMAQLDRFLAVRAGQEAPSYRHPLLEPILAETGGVILYQEQVIQIAQAVAGMSAGEADLLRRAMGKKDPDLMASERERFISGAKARGVPVETAGAIFDDIARFAGYGFNKSHAAAYALLSYGMAWLLTYHPLPYLAELLSAASGDEVARRELEQSALRRGLRLLPVDINRSDVNWTVEEGGLRPGLASLRYMGEKAAAALVEARTRGGPYRSLIDLELRVGRNVVHRNLLETLAAAGALRGLGAGEPREVLITVELDLDAQRVMERLATLSRALERVLAGTAAELVTTPFETAPPGTARLPPARELGVEEPRGRLYLKLNFNPKAPVTGSGLGRTGIPRETGAPATAAAGRPAGAAATAAAGPGPGKPATAMAATVVIEAGARFDGLAGKEAELREALRREGLDGVVSVSVGTIGHWWAQVGG
ncbi:MAG TPA: DNA polymerase III subunit alpha [Firmicutes bacterium]|nr:DNA polymerase III subunit alpha [Bacillota bacterium]